MLNCILLCVCVFLSIKCGPVTVHGSVRCVCVCVLHAYKCCPVTAQVLSDFYTYVLSYLQSLSVSELPNASSKPLKKAASKPVPKPHKAPQRVSTNPDARAWLQPGTTANPIASSAQPTSRFTASSWPAQAFSVLSV